MSSGVTRRSQLRCGSAAELRRRSLRRAVHVSCELRSELWDGAVRMVVRDLSGEGMWIETDLALAAGDEVLASFSPPGSCVRLNALCEVNRVSLWRRASDPLPSGMGLSFVDLSHHDRGRLSRSLIGIPPPLPLALRLRGGRPAADAAFAGRAAKGALPNVLDPALAASA